MTALLTRNAIVQGDCVELLSQLEDESVDLAFADPPFNIGFKYDEYHDRHEDEVYLSWCAEWFGELYRVLKPTGAFWLAIGDEYAAELKVAAKEIGFSPRNWVVWYYTFGQNCRKKFNRSHAHLFHFAKDEEQHTFNADDPAVRVPSARALVYGDKRANATGRLPDDTWMLPPVREQNDWVLRPQDLREDAGAFSPLDDTWYFSRVAGTFKEREGFHGCQMPEQLLGRIVRVSSNPGDLVLDPFGGSGTTLAVAKKLGRDWLGFELSSEYAKYGNERLERCKEGDPLNGPADPVESSPTTAAGRRLKDHPLTRDKEQLLPTFRKEDFSQPEPPADDDAVADVATTNGAPAAAVKTDLRALLREAIVGAFSAANEGHSVDWLLCDPALQDAFHAACGEAGLIGGPSDWNRELLRLRKAGKLAKGRGAGAPIDFSPEATDHFRFAAEMAWADAMKKYPGWSLDAIFCSPGKALYFDRSAMKHLPAAVAKEIGAAPLRWAALKLRKARHALAAEAHQYHYVLATRDFSRFHPWGRCRFDKWEGQPGLYCLRRRDRSAVYVGEADDLGARLATHASAKAPGRVISQVAVITGDELPSDEYRGALWTSLVRRYEPRLNVEPAKPPAE
ncbi:DNA adenine methyltransferase YhdJ [Pseudobythopirellula maris]|uniref:DNA adenine methyltransferase YhdJ n=1 Tax=Pseudobythopirellula maris TaxID=2527991 RepID=A0A5C5ZUL6_9BACT|nr:DNA methyltransferase [Pseudobythopirellula maris]TWT90900.1 DNA adenine methyltransferase YhdJ [Pseudobythopirellula maris]